MFGFSFLLIVITFLAWVTCSLIKPSNVIKFRSNSISILNEEKKINRGGSVLARFDYCKFLETPDEISVDLENNKQLFLLKPPSLQFKTGCHRSVDVLTIVPVSLPIEATNLLGTGKSLIRVTLTYHTNKFKTARHTILTEEFIITP